MNKSTGDGLFGISQKEMMKIEGANFIQEIREGKLGILNDANKIGCGKKMLKAFSIKDEIVSCGDYNSADDYIHLCGECRFKKQDDVLHEKGEAQ